MNTKTEVLKILNNNDDFVSGEEMSRLIGVSRAAVNTAVKALRADGFDISSSTNRGYRLMAMSDRLTEEGIGAYMDRDRMENIVVLKSVDSTNMELLRRISRGALNGQVVISDAQTSGMGRKGRPFASPEGSGLYLSYLFKPSDKVKEEVRGSGGGLIWASITSWTAVAAADAIEKVSGVRPGIKWVNDLYINGRKISGILTQMNTSAEIMEVESIIIGIGINVSEGREDFPAEIQDKAGSIFSETLKKVNRAELAAYLIAALDRMSSGWPYDKELYYERYLADSIVIGRDITVIGPCGSERLKARSIDRDFTLIAEDENGNSRKIVGGDVSLLI